MSKFIAIIMLALLTFTLSACSTPAASNDSGGTPSEASNTAAPEQSPVESENTTQDTTAPDEEGPSTEPSDSGNATVDENGMIRINISVGSEVFAAEFYDNESARAIVSEMPFTLEMDDYASQEKVTGLTFALPSTSTETPATINAGDIYLWSGNNLVLFYTSFANSYSYVPIGYVVDTTGLVNALGTENVSVAFEVGR